MTASVVRPLSWMTALTKARLTPVPPSAIGTGPALPDFVNAAQTLPPRPLVHGLRPLRHPADQEEPHHRRVQGARASPPPRPRRPSGAATATCTRSASTGPSTAPRTATSRVISTIPAIPTPNRRSGAAASSSRPCAASSRARRSPTITAPTISRTSSAARTANARAAGAGGPSARGNCAPPRNGAPRGWRGRGGRRGSSRRSAGAPNPGRPRHPPACPVGAMGR